MGGRDFSQEKGGGGTFQEKEVAHACGKEKPWLE